MVRNYWYQILVLMISCTVFSRSETIAAKNIATIPLSELLRWDASATYLKCHDRMMFNFDPFPLSVWPELQPSQGMLQETFILTLAQGQVYSDGKNIPGFIMKDGYLIEELIWPSKERFFARHPEFIIKLPSQDITKIKGSVAVIAQEGKAYAHWTLEILGRLALLEIYGIPYDHLYVPIDESFKKETLQLWGVDITKVIQPFGDTRCIQADQLIVPSLLGRKYPALDHKPLFCLYLQPEILNYVRDRFLRLSDQQEQITPAFAKRVFISRKDARIRKMTNEDEVFKLFKVQGFERYNLTNLSVMQQVALFKNAEIIVGSHGSGLTNIIFCSPGTRVIEFFQTRGDCTFWYLSQMLGLQHECIKTADFHIKDNGSNTHVPLSLVQSIVDTL